MNATLRPEPRLQAEPNPGVEAEPKPRLQADPKPQPARMQSWIGVAILLSLGLHAALIGLGVLWARQRVPVALVPLEIPATVQLEMSPPGGATPPAATPQPPTPPSPQASRPATEAAKPAASAAKPAPAKSNTTDAAAKAPLPPETAKDGVAAAEAPEATPTATPVTAATPNAAATAAAEAKPPAPTSPPPARQAAVSGDSKLSFDFASVESDTNALVTGDLMVPASPDRKYHNRKPSYPLDAAWRGEHGMVVLLIHVSPEGLVSGVDVLRSSGFSALDHAAEDAVVTWHFLPSVKDGRPVPADVPMRFEFELD